MRDGGMRSDISLICRAGFGMGGSRRDRKREACLHMTVYREYVFIKELREGDSE